jgi:hypothetical protein
MKNKLTFNLSLFGFNEAKIKANPLKLFLVLSILFVSISNAFATTLTVNVRSSSNSVLSPTPIYRLSKGPNFIGNFNEGDSYTFTSTGTYSFSAVYNGSSTRVYSVTVNSLSDPNFVFDLKTTRLRFNFSSTINYRTSGSWSSFGTKTGSPSLYPARELFPKDFNGNTMTLQLPNSLIITIDYDNQTTFERDINVLRILADDNTPLSGATFRGGNGSSFAGWHVSGSSNTSGILVDLRPFSTNGSYSYEARFNATTASIGPQTTSSNSYFNFKTIKLTLKLETCSNVPLSGGTVRYGNGSNSSSTFFPTPNSTNSSGESVGQFFPGTYSFEMNYQTSSQVKTNVSIPNSNTTLTWQTTNLTLDWPTAISYGGAGGNSRAFNKPSMELLAGNINFLFSGSGVQPINIAGCNMQFTPLITNSSNINVVQLNGLYDNNGVAVTNDAVNITWQVRPTSNINGFSITPQWLSAAGLSGFDLTDVGLYMRTTNTDYTGVGTWALISSGNGSINSGVNSFGPSSIASQLNSGTNYYFAITNSPLTPLPVKLLSFDAHLINQNNVKVNWVTENESNSKGFYVETSANSKTWTNAGFVNSQSSNGQSEIQLNYSSLINTVGLNSDLLFIRLKQVDLDGQFYYSHAVIVNLTNKTILNDVVKISPNPVQDILQVNINANATDEVNVALYDVFGRAIETVSLINNQIDMSTLPSGIYMLKVNINGVVLTERIIK